jgi:16S rRNA (cytidine1402-2'-O)-methyltransferase
MQERLEPVLTGQVWGIVSDAGLPCIADPGARFVRLAKQKGVKVEALSGPSSITQALMLSGLSAQKFFFQGYLPREPELLRMEICKLEKEAKERGCTQVCIERPYRSAALLTAFLEHLQENTILSIAADLGSLNEQSFTFSVRQWRRKDLPDFHKKPCVFLLASTD